MGSREKILANISRQPTEPKPLPALDSTRLAASNVVADYIATLERIGGKAIEASSWAAVQEYVEKYASGFNRIVSTVPELPWSIPANSENPHSFENVDLAIMKAHFGVAENAASWITDECMGDRALPFIAQNLALVIKKKSIVATLHQAYQIIDLQNYNFGTFIAGPSKTADIEQSLVLGAHGPKSLVVFLMDDI